MPTREIMEINEEELYKRVVRRSKPKITVQDIAFDLSDPLLILKIISDYLWQFPKSETLLEERVRKLEKELEQLKRQVKVHKVYTKADIIYEKKKNELERKYFGKIVAIDTETEEIVGIGDTLLEAYEMAKKKTSKDKFSFRKVGYPYVYRLV